MVPKECIQPIRNGFRQMRAHSVTFSMLACDGKAALDISTGPLARRTFQTAGPVRASTFYLSLARTGHLDICRATRFQIVLARTMTIHSVYFSRGRSPPVPHLGSFRAALLLQRDASVSRVRVWHVNQTH